jgi:hypothetical protein
MADEILDGEVFDSQQGVVLDQPARDLMEETVAGVGNPGVLTSKPPGGSCVVPGAALRARHGTLTDGSFRFAASASVTNRRHSLYANLDAPTCQVSIRS